MVLRGSEGSRTDLASRIAPSLGSWPCHRSRASSLLVKDVFYLAGAKVKKVTKSDLGAKPQKSSALPFTMLQESHLGSILRFLLRSGKFVPLLEGGAVFRVSSAEFTPERTCRHLGPGSPNLTILEYSCRIFFARARAKKRAKRISHGARMSLLGCARGVILGPLFDGL